MESLSGSHRIAVSPCKIYSYCQLLSTKTRKKKKLPALFNCRIWYRTPNDRRKRKPDKTKSSASSSADNGKEAINHQSSALPWHGFPVAFKPLSAQGETWRYYPQDDRQPGDGTILQARAAPKKRKSSLPWHTITYKKPGTSQPAAAREDPHISCTFQLRLWAASG